ncbi:MAG: T9SS type A sorting domain-containing protein, partial [Calditrichaeota bacterium]|nr:T9SS type A sorting domain-containing protein [Calditrichota bacterium]
RSSFFGPVSVSAPKVTAIALQQNYPNPFNPTTNITFELPKAMHVRLVIYNLNGQLISALVDGELNAGYHTASWNGLDQTGRQMPSGVYYYQLCTKNCVETRKLLLMK